MLLDRLQAVAAGKKRYFTGELCSKGHIAERLTSSKGCVICHRENVAKRRAANPELNKQSNTEAKRKWVKAHPERVAIANEKRRGKNLAARREAMSAAYAKDPEKFKRRALQWAKSNPGKVGARNMRRKAASKEATPKWVNWFFVTEIYELAKLRSKLTGIPHHVDHILPLRGKSICGLHVESNMRVVPASENLKKGTKLLESIGAHAL